MEKNMRQLSDGIDRRNFLKLSGMLGLGLTAAVAIPASAEAVKFDRKLYKVSETRVAMGTFRIHDASAHITGSGPGGHQARPLRKWIG